MNYQVSSVKYTLPEEHKYPGSYTATIIKVEGKINLEDIMLPRTEGRVLVENNKNQWVFMENHAEDEYACCVDNMLERYDYMYDQPSRYYEAEDDNKAETAHNLLEHLCYIREAQRG